MGHVRTRCPCGLSAARGARHGQFLGVDHVEQRNDDAVDGAPVDKPSPDSRPGLGLDTITLGAVAALFSLLPLIGFGISAAGVWRTYGTRFRHVFWATAGLALLVSLLRLLSASTPSAAFYSHAVGLFLGLNIFGWTWYIRSTRSRF